MDKALQGFKPIYIQFSVDTNPKTMFMKEHSTRNQSEDKPHGRTMYLLNVPPWADESSIHKAFNSHSTVQSVTFTKFKDTTHTGFKCCYIIFKTEKDLYKALNLKKLEPISTEKEPILMGIDKYVKQYNEGLLNQHQREQNMLEIIKAYDAEEVRKKSKTLETDDEGWTVVTKKGRNPGLSRKESVAEKLMAKNKKDKVLKNFYRHQIRQAKKDQLAALRKKAEEDKKKILALKQRRAFKPF
ncbi:ribosomal RNA-processing protein 7 homolog A [Atheta coriaria]|uniref:ribosomal RNA-processing protein 7 homolog A n=1 Tax=Dalotia coriaria TaxID=877792 RepID=UPI0031F42369